MKYFLAILLVIATVGVSAQQATTIEKDYLPQIKALDMSLVEGTAIGQWSEKILKSGFKEYPELQKYFLEEQKNVRYFRMSLSGADLTYELKYLDDGRIYQMNLYMAHSGTESTGAGMMGLKILFNGATKKIVGELGMPTKYILIMLSPYSEEDYSDDDLAMKALKAFSLVNSAQWYSKKYKGTKWEKMPVIEVGMHFTNRVRCSITDIELSKLAGKS